LRWRWQGEGRTALSPWGALQFLLDDLKDRVEFAAISGTSGGSMNAAVAAYGLRLGQPDPNAAAKDTDVHVAGRTSIRKFVVGVYGDERCPVGED
jgi:predicted acylesterase/phospholipase RssA